MSKHISDILKVIEFANTIISDLHEHIDLLCKLMPDIRKEEVLDKLVSETALLLLLVARLPQQDIFNCSLLNIANKLARYARSPRFLFLLAESPQTTVGVCLAHVVLNNFGIIDNFFDETVKAAFLSKFVGSVDRPNFRQMEMRWLQGLSQDQQPDFADLLPSSALLQHLHPIYMRREDAYAATHAAMYLTDFGKFDLPILVDHNLIVSFVEHTISWCLAYSDWDLLAEVLMVHAFSDRADSVYSIIGIEVLRNIFQKHSLVPGINFDPKLYNELSYDKNIKYLTMQAYHSTYVYGMLLAVILSKKSCTLDQEDFSKYLNMTDLRFPADWLSNNWKLSTIQTGSSDVNGVLLNSKLIRLAREGQFNELMSNVEVGEKNGMARVLETCDVASEKIIQFLRATAYKRNMQESRHGIPGTSYSLGFLLGKFKDNK